MNSSSAVIISLLFCHRAVSSAGSLLSEETLLNGEDILGQFFAETKLSLDRGNPRHVTVVGASDDQLRQTKSLLEAFPHFVGKDAKEFCASKEFSPSTLLVYFLASLEEEYLTAVMGTLFNCNENRMYFIFEGITAEDVNIESMLNVAFQKITKLSVFIIRSEKSLKLYGYKMGADCSRRAEVLVDWIPGVDMEKLDDWANRYIHEGCPISVGTMHHPPWISLAENTDGVVRIDGGSEGEMISTLAQKMNLLPFVHEFKLADDVKSHNTVAIVSSCAARKIDIGVAQIRPRESVVDVVDISQGYADECVVWCVPRITHWKRNIIVSEFSWNTWLLIGLTFLASFTVEEIIRKTHYLNRGIDQRSGCCDILLDLIRSTLYNPTVYRSFSIGGKILLITYLCYSMIITTAYKTALSSILTVDNRESLIIHLDDIIRANLTTGGDVYRLAILEEQAGENEAVAELIKRYVVEPNISKALRQVSYRKNLAYLTPVSNLIYHKNLLAEAGESVSFDVLNGCVLTHSTVIVFPKSSPLTERINQITLRLVDGGILGYWMKNHSHGEPVDFRSAGSSARLTTQEDLYMLTRDKFYQVFRIYCLALIFCVFIFLGELLLHKFKLRNRIQRFKNFKRFKLGRCMPL